MIITQKRFEELRTYGRAVKLADNKKVVITPEGEIVEVEVKRD